MKSPHEYVDEMMFALLTTIAIVWIFLILA